MPRTFDLPDLPDWRTRGAFPSAVLGAVGGIAWLAVSLCGILGGFASFGFDAPIAAGWEPRQLRASVTFVSLMIVFVFACALPHRRVVVRNPYRRTQENGAHG